VGSTAARGFKRIGVGGIGDRRKMQLAGKDGSRQSGFERSQIEHGAHSAAIFMEISAALAEWVRAPTLMKSTPVSA